MKIGTVGLLHPGQMGVTLGIAAGARADVVWASQGRGEATRHRARNAGFRDLESLAALTRQSDLILCVCPPDMATTVARSVHDLGFDGTYVDANAISPATRCCMRPAVSASSA